MATPLITTESTSVLPLNVDRPDHPLVRTPPERWSRTKRASADST